MTTPDDDLPLSKTRRKQAMEELQALGEELVALASDQVKRIDIPDDLRSAVSEAQRMTRQDEAKRRQMQYIGKLMRSVEVEPIRAALALVRGESAGETAKLHRLERLRADFLADEKVVHEIAQRYPGVDLQHLRSLRRAALKEQEQNKPPRSYRALFQRLKELENAVEESASEPVSTTDTDDA
jgi:ribosome-associated protein